MTHGEAEAPALCEAEGTLAFGGIRPGVPARGIFLGGFACGIVALTKVLSGVAHNLFFVTGRTSLTLRRPPRTVLHSHKRPNHGLEITI